MLLNIAASSFAFSFRPFRDIEEFEGPILSELRGAGGAPYIEKWCDCAGDVVRTLVVRSDHRAIAEYVGGRLTMRRLLVETSDDFGFLIDRARGVTQRVTPVKVSTLPEEYLPKVHAKHDISLRPRWPVTPQTFLLEGKWDARLIAKLEKLYLETFAFTFFTRHDSREFPARPLRYKLDGGYSYGRAFTELSVRVPANENAKSAAITAASPGMLSIDAPSTTADEVIAALVAAQRPGAAAAYSVLHAWSRKKMDTSHQLTGAAIDDFRRLCDLLGVAHHKLFQGQSKEALLVAGKLIASYFRKLVQILKPNLTWDGVEFISPELETTDFHPSAELLQEDEDFDYDFDGVDPEPDDR